MEIHKNNKTLNYLVIFKYFFFWIFFSVLTLLMKYVVINYLSKFEFLTNSNKIFSIIEVHNSGAAFNILSGYQDFIITASIFTLIALTLILIIYSSKLNQITIMAIAALNSGITMNTIERIRWGYVIDYFYFNFHLNIPVFNIADIMIIIGAFVLTYSIIKKSKDS